MQHHGLVGEFYEGFGEREGLPMVRLCSNVGHGRAQERRTNGRSRVPKPPTRMSAAEEGALAFEDQIVAA